MTKKIVLSKDFFSEDYFRDEDFIKGIKALLSGRKKSNYFDYKAMADNKNCWHSIIKIIEKYGISGRFLDIGCAYGYLLKYTPSNFKEIHGYDISEFAIKQATKNAPTAKLTVGDINTDTPPYKDGYFDLVTALEILEHTESIELSLRKIVPKLKKDGFLIISLPIRGTFWGKIFQLIDIDKSHINVPRNEKQVLAIINRLGLKVIEINHPFITPWGEINGINSALQLVLQKK